MEETCRGSVAHPVSLNALGPLGPMCAIEVGGGKSLEQEASLATTPRCWGSNDSHQCQVKPHLVVNLNRKCLSRCVAWHLS